MPVSISSKLPYKFEAGTPNYIGSYAFSKALEYVQEIGIEDIAKHEEELVEYIEERLSGLEHVKIYAAGQKKAGAVSFNVYRADGGLIHPFDVINPQHLSNGERQFCSYERAYEH